MLNGGKEEEISWPISGTIIPAGKEVLLINCFDEGKEVRISEKEIYL